MRKHRSWLMGFGVGIMLGASILQVIHLAKEQEKALAEADAPISRNRLEKAAKEQGLALVPAGQKTYTEDELRAMVDQAVAAARKEANAPGAGTSVNNAGGGTNPPSPSAAPSSAPSSAQPAKAGKTEPKAVTLYVRAGMSLTDVAERLQQLGVIADAADFVAKEKAYSRKLEVGTCVFVGKPTYKQIVAELTRPKP